MPYNNNYKDIFSQVLASLREEIGATSYDIWFSTVKFQLLKKNKIYIYVPNSLNKEWIESRYLDNIQNKFRALTNQEISLVLTTDIIDKNDDYNLNLNNRYTFESFVVGNSNRFAHAACFAVGESPSRAYNPLFIYGGVGLGKTHLMHAIGHRILQNNSKFKVMYVSSEQFTNELIGSIKDDNTSGFRNKYRGIDVLLIDDIQFLAGKERTQEEFFHTFNTLYESNKQLVISSDRPPKNIPTLEDRLRSRFEWGLITDIQPPDLETRIAILRKKAQTDGLNIPFEIIDYIASCIDSNIRELEGALVRLVAYTTISNKPINMETAIEALKDILPPPKPRHITIEIIQKEVCDYYKIGQNEILSKKRNKQLVFPRQVAMFLCRKLTDASYPLIGDQFGGRDHTTVMHSVEKIEKELETSPDLKLSLDEICKQIDPTYTSE